MLKEEIALVKKLTSKKGVSPILAALLLIAIAVAAAVITYAWVTTFMTTQTQQSGAVLALENTRFYEVGLTKNMTDITIMNTGTASAKIASVYWSDSSFLDLVKLTATTDYTTDPTDGIVNAGSSITITVKWGVSTITGNWTSGTTYYFKIVTDAGQQYPFAAKAP